MKKLEKIKILPFLIFQTFLMMLVGLLMGIVYSFGGLIIDTLVSIDWITSEETPGLSYGTILAFGALIGMPIIFAAIGFVFAIAEAILYNLFVKWFGGLNIDFT